MVVNGSRNYPTYVSGFIVKDIKMFVDLYLNEGLAVIFYQREKTD